MAEVEKTSSVKPVVIEGVCLPPFQPDAAAWEKKIQQIRQMTLRDDDVFLLTYPKAGTHWLFEVITLLRKGQAEPNMNRMTQLMIEMVHTDKLAELPSPRTFVTHLPFSLLPVTEMKTRRLKTVHLYRNPKDACSSMFHMLRSAKGMAAAPTDTFDEFFEFYFCSNKIGYGPYVKYLRQVHEFQQLNPEVPSLNLSFEDVKKDPVGCVKKLAQFLCLTVSDELCSQIAQACSFDNMKKQAAKKTATDLGSGEKTALSDRVMRRPPVIYRKGQAGDWKNHFTVALSERVDDLIKQELQDLPFTFTFE